VGLDQAIQAQASWPEEGLEEPILVEAGLVLAMVQHPGPGGREEAIAVRCRRIVVVAAGGSVAAVAVAVGGCILLFYCVERRR
jgi:hypothetical protein